MDILIKGMEMPENNESIKVFIITSEGVFLMVDEGKGKKLDAVEVPPHGRLIDADAEIKAWEQTKIVLKECDQKRTFAFKEACIAAKVLRDALTVLEANNG